jgi:Kef-type K+ transport system membrane component KefB
MNHHELILLFLQFGVMLAVAVVSGQIMCWLRQPAVLGELIGGIILGPKVFGYLAGIIYQSMLYVIVNNSLHRRYN